VVGCDGYVKLTDFGLSAEAASCTRICGTDEYIAPEVLSGKPYGQEVDWWALGILFFELLFGRTPFFAINRDRMREKIVNRPVIVPDHSGSSEVPSLIYGLLEKDPKMRFGFEDIVRHPFFFDIDFKELLEKRIEPKFIPDVFDPGCSIAKNLNANRVSGGSYDIGNATVETWKSVGKSVEWSFLAQMNARR
jgi:serine/threonine protein kinase